MALSLSRFVSRVMTVVLALAATAATAQQYPAKPIRLISPFAPGGGASLVARIIGQEMSDAWGQSVVVDNRGGAGGSMVIYLAGLQSVPTHLYEAAEIDGAGPWQKFWTVTVPMMSPVIFYNIIVGIIASLQNFVTVLVMTSGISSQPGGPANSTMMYGLYLYLNAFRFFKMGYASALAWVLLVIIICFTALQFRLARLWVFYEGETKR